MVKQIKDDGGSVIPLLSYKTRGGSSLIYAVGSANTSSELTGKAYSVTASSNAFIELSSNALAASNTASHFIVANLPYQFSINAESTNVFISVTGAGASGTLYISERA